MSDTPPSPGSGTQRPRPAHVKMADVARAAQVSVATVSRVINGHPSLTEETRERVLQAIGVMNYRPNRAAQNLRARRSTLVGVVVPDIANPYFMAVARGCEDVAQESGLSVIIASTDENPEKERRQLESMVDHGVTHLVWAPAREKQTPVDLLSARNVRCVLVDRDVAGSPYDVVLNDDADAIGRLIAVLLDAGHREIAVVAGPQSSFTGRVRLEATRAALEASGAALPPGRVVIGDFMDGFGYTGVLQLLQQPDRPTAILASNNIMMEGVIRAARLLRLSIPEDLSLVGIAERQFLDLVDPPMTVAQQDPKSIGRLAMQILMGPGSPGAPRQSLRVPVPIVMGASVRRLFDSSPPDGAS